MKWKIISILIFLFLLANFCWNGKPLYKTLLKTDISKSTEKIVDSAKQEVQEGLNKAKDTLKEASDTVTEKASDADLEGKKEKVIEISKKAAKEADDLTEKDKKGMQELLKDKLK